MMTYEEAVNYIESQAIYGLKPGFERMNGLMDRLGHPEKGLTYIHVAGTNGKGSVSTETANILQAAGLHVGLFTSPYVLEFRERIRFDGEFIEKDLLAELTEQVKAAVDDLKTVDIQPTEFEIITALGFLYFQRKPCDVVVLEVGLGGLLDSTNIIDSALCCGIVSLSLDHTAILGDTIEDIAFQKAGIMKPGVPVITAEGQPEAAMPVLRNVAEEKGCALHIGSTDGITVLGESIYGMELSIEGETLTLPMAGKHQIQNLGVTLGMVRELRKQGYSITPKHIKEGLERTRVPARLEVLRKEPLVLLDGGHNADGVAALCNALHAFTKGMKLTFVMGVMADKEVDIMVTALAPLASRIIATTPTNPRAMKAQCLREEIMKRRVPEELCLAVDDPCKAVDQALALSGPNPVIVCGSLYLAGDVRQHMIDVLTEH